MLFSLCHPLILSLSLSFTFPPVCGALWPRERERGAKYGGENVNWTRHIHWKRGMRRKVSERERERGEWIARKFWRLFLLRLRWYWCVQKLRKGNGSLLAVVRWPDETSRWPALQKKERVFLSFKEREGKKKNWNWLKRTVREDSALLLNLIK